ncbi:thioesterase [Archaeoglobales archaeon]|nr:MAG: thioesterase [Archaeoglobales archaeon]
MGGVDELDTRIDNTINSKIKTHKLASKELVGEVMEIKEKEAKVRLKALKEMAVDERGLIHGGFTFGLADLAAMVAVNHPNVVLGRAEVKFTKPVKVGDEIIAHAKVVEVKGKKNLVEVIVRVQDNIVLEGIFHCYVLDKHVLN